MTSEPHVADTHDTRYTASHRGRPGPNTTFRQARTTRPRLTWELRSQAVRRAAASDGCWPLITNAADLTRMSLMCGEV